MATAQKRRGRAATDDNVFSAEEKAALRETARERKAQARSKDLRADGEADVQAKIAEMTGSDHAIATRLHELITKAVPELATRTWYGMPAYTLDGKLVCFFKAAAKFNYRYATLGFEDAARLDDGTMWPTSYAITTLTKADEATIVELVKKAAR
jgi:hypothetical protein